MPNLNLTGIEEILLKQFEMLEEPESPSKWEAEESDEQWPEEEDTELVKIVKAWLGSMVGGAEKFICALIAVFLFVYLFASQLYVHVLSRYQSFQDVQVCEKLVSDYDRYNEEVTFECHVKLLIAAWVGAMLTSALVLVVYFLLWFLRLRLIAASSSGVAQDGEDRRYSFDDIHKNQ